MNNEETKTSEQSLLPKHGQVILTIASRLLSYPPESMDELKHAIESFVEQEMDVGMKKKDLQNAYTRIFRLPSKMLRKWYVSTFDLRSNLGLYLTAQEFGDSPKRGAALIKLQNTISRAGYEFADDELADYIPMLLEFITVAPESAEHIRLYKRLSVAIHRMISIIDQVNPYAGILHVLSIHVFPKPTEKEVAEMENNREEADLEELPFPIMYQ